MKLAPLSVLLTLLLTACSQTAPPAETESARATATTSVIGSAVGTVEAVDQDAHTVTIAHGPVEDLHWPPMTMTFQAGNVGLGPVKKGDRVSFRFTATGMNGTLVSIQPVK